MNNDLPSVNQPSIKDWRFQGRIYLFSFLLGIENNFD